MAWKPEGEGARVRRRAGRVLGEGYDVKGGGAPVVREYSADVTGRREGRQEEPENGGRRMGR